MSLSELPEFFQRERNRGSVCKSKEESWREGFLLFILGERGISKLLSGVFLLLRSRLKAAALASVVLRAGVKLCKAFLPGRPTPSPSQWVQQPPSPPPPSCFFLP